ncbi:MAG: rhodanese-like domain-containing protein [Desulfonatronovibrionaceae bacterium]
MDKMDQALREMDFDFFGSGEHSISVPEAARVYEENKAFFLDVRTREEVGLLNFPRAKNIPVSELPDRLDEIPAQGLVIVMCSSIFRAALVYGYLLSKGFDSLKGLTGSIEQLAAQLKPGPLYQRSGRGK